MKRNVILVVLFTIMMPLSGWAAHPLITDDTGTQGKSKFQIEINGQYDSHKETIGGISIEATGSSLSTVVSYGLMDVLDLVVEYPYQSVTVKADGVTVFDDQGSGDVTLAAKWRFHERGHTSLAVKPVISLPTGDEKKGFGTGKTGYSGYLILSHAMELWTNHLNLGYMRYENKGDGEKNLWHASIAMEYAAMDHLRIVANIGMEKNPDKTADDDPAFILGGVIYGINKNFDIDAGVKFGLNDAEADLSVLAGVAIRF